MLTRNFRKIPVCTHGYRHIKIQSYEQITGLEKNQVRKENDYMEKKKKVKLAVIFNIQSELLQ